MVSDCISGGGTTLAQPPKYILGLEGSANKLGVSIINSNFEILVNMRRTYISEIGCGFIPRQINAHHKYYIIEMIKDCLTKLKIKITDVHLICYTKGPGIGSALYIAYNISKFFSLLFNIPVIGVNHCIAHIEMGIFITKLYHPIILYVSGSNTQIIYFNDHKKRYEIIGETLDIAIGNVIDRSARILRISNSPSPGYNVEILARKKYLLNLEKKKKKKNAPIGGSFAGGEPHGGSAANEPNTPRTHDKPVRADPCDYTELLFFPYTIKGMDISFSGYDYYVSKYFSRYLTKRGKKGKGGENAPKRKKRHEGGEANGGGRSDADSVNGEEDDHADDAANRGNPIAGAANDGSTQQFPQPNLSIRAGVQGSSYYEENVVCSSGGKRNYGEGEHYAEEDDCAIETESDFFDSSEEQPSSGSSEEQPRSRSSEEKARSRSTEEQPRNESSEEKPPSGGSLTDEEKRKIQICYSLQHHIFSMLIEITERAIAFTNSKEVIIVGGVGCNVFLQNMMKKMAKQKNIKIGFMDHSYCVDNGAMIAYTGYLEFANTKNREIYGFDNISIHQRYRTDDVLVTWR
ncbi:tRNA N6-adenosine threonylcarbamoyltransferase, putative [Plasmodium vivax]|uniref:N(6)-L-threonylcarbamoyladenine synthase n=4 Tax=Plasmodium vivax TaxID=5855 RepID=A5KDZ1_PLAVS|nr:O-sialoglycoprotein endopeptidase, putative [Plasmodium vivax]EDL42440.1 O-sialoglycoprotein endopeptidase, putative [Plasmodium vivax]KMZ81463.1 O-sialoglycoprotein endopeptidase [Plasmodium vivax India VII]KMZ87620.1 O-sialoglycoprotein endopeptidase [Plasmodium vivax Brazil I]SCO71676.1 tRNA N6-adenosine threonylcarbamoyltransferase, putative [Plasmodium vivax]|eukprot:XP_001608464.1 O-sialoglycoprotein endopeptidase [Plasmodium vivax Sal-1]